jgi:GMP synthase PP-ATPase subunit
MSRKQRGLFPSLGLKYRQPFPEPGLTLRIIGAITSEKLQILKEADVTRRSSIKPESIILPEARSEILI